MCAARERILSNLQKHPIPRPAPELQQQKAPVAEAPATCFTDSKAAVELMRQDLCILQDQARYMDIKHTLYHNQCTHAYTLFVGTHTQNKCYTKPPSDSEILGLGVRTAVASEAQQVAMEQELLESLPLLYKNRSEQVTMALECKGTGGMPCQGPANITVTVHPLKLHIFHIMRYHCEVFAMVC